MDRHDQWCVAEPKSTRQRTMWMSPILVTMPNIGSTFSCLSFDQTVISCSKRYDEALNEQNMALGGILTICNLFALGSWSFITRSVFNAT